MPIRGAVGLGLCGLAAAWLSAQQSAPVFHAGTRLVEVTVTVLDKKGNAVTGLETADFTVLDEGKPRPIEFFRFDGGSRAAPVAHTAAAPGVFSNRPEVSGDAHPNITALVLDTLNTPPAQSQQARAQMMRYLRAMAPRTQVAILLMGRQLRTLHDFTDDPAALLAKLEKSTPGMPLNTVTDYPQSVVEAEAFVNLFAGDPKMQAMIADMMRTSLEVESMANSAARRERMERSLEAMEALGSHLAGIPGRKNLVWIGAGFSMVSITGAMGMGPRGDVESFENRVRDTSRRLAQEGVVLYIVDSQGLALPSDTSAASKAPLPTRGRGRFEPQMDTEAMSNDPHPAMEMMASITGGRYLFNTNDLAAGFRQAAADVEGSYTLGFYLAGDTDDKWHRLKVRVRRSGVNVRHREGFFASSGDTQPAEWTGERWNTAFRNPVSSTVIPLTVTCSRTKTGEVAIALVADAGAMGFHAEGDAMKAELEVGLAARMADGSAFTNRTGFTASVPMAQWGEVRARGISYQKQWKPPEGAIAMRVIVHDVRTGQYGSVDVPIGMIP